MTAPPSKSAISGTPTNAEAKTAFAALWDYVVGRLGGDAAAPAPSDSEKTAARSALGVPKSDGTGASGTWPISISGSAASAGSASSAASLSGTTTAAVPTTALGSGTASASTFLAGDRTFKTISLTPTTTDVLNATAGASVGAVGTYAFLGETNITPTAAGGTRAGSALRYAGVAGTTSWADTEVFGFIGVGSGGTPSGTWRAMGRSYGNNIDKLGATLWLRIS